MSFSPDSKIMIIPSPAPPISSPISTALRRFTFKVKFDFLLADQLETAFERFFSLPAPRSLRQVASLSLGDFAVVKKQLSFRADRSPAAEDIVALLAAETTAKQQGPQRIGF